MVDTDLLDGQAEGEKRVKRLFGRVHESLVGI